MQQILHVEPNKIESAPIIISCEILAPAPAHSDDKVDNHPEKEVFNESDSGELSAKKCCIMNKIIKIMNISQ